MEDFISEIYNFAQLIPATKEIIDKYYEEDTLHGKRQWDEISDLFVDYCNVIDKSDPDLAARIMKNLENACAQTLTVPPNYRLMGNILEETIPLLYEAMSVFGQIDVNEDNYRLFSSKSGFLSLYNTQSKRYYHDLIDPYREAYILAKRIYRPAQLSYAFLGCGLGYLPWAVFCNSNLSADIYIYHNNPRIVEFAEEYGVLSFIPEDKLHIVIEENIDTLLDKYEHCERLEDFGIYQTYDVFDEASDKQKERITQIHINSDGSFLYDNRLKINFWRNRKNVINHFSKFDNYNPNADWIVVAAGPSLDNHLDYIKENVGGKNIICASTVLKKLLKYDIKPNCVAVLDPQSRTYNHFEGLEDFSVPLILNTTGNWKFGEYYKGPKYYIPSCTDETSILYYKARNTESYNLGSTVSSMSIVIALLFKAKRIELVGIDLAYPNGYTHAKDTMDCKQISYDGMCSVTAVDGQTVYSTYNFIFYANQINSIIKNNPGTEFINFSDNGIKFENCKWYKEL